LIKVSRGKIFKVECNYKINSTKSMYFRVVAPKISSKSKESKKQPIEDEMIIYQICLINLNYYEFSSYILLSCFITFSLIILAHLSNIHYYRRLHSDAILFIYTAS